MQLKGYLQDGDLHLSFPQLLEGQIKSILTRHDVGFAPVSRIGQWKEDRPTENVSALRLITLDLERIEQLLIQAFAESEQPWMLVKPSFTMVGFKRFDWDIERRPAETGAPELTRWFDTSLKEVPSRVGPYEGMDEHPTNALNPSFYYWDGRGWGMASRTAAASRLLTAGARGPGPRYWRGLVAQAA